MKGWEFGKLRGGVDTEAHWAPSDGSPVDLSRPIPEFLPLKPNAMEVFIMTPARRDSSS